VRDEHEMTLVTHARVSNHRRHDFDDDRRTCSKEPRSKLRGIKRQNPKGLSRVDPYVAV